MSQNFCIPIVLWIQNHAKESYNHTDLTQWMGDEVQLPIKKKKINTKWIAAFCCYNNLASSERMYLLTTYTSSSCQVIRQSLPSPHITKLIKVAEARCPAHTQIL